MNAQRWLGPGSCAGNGDLLQALEADPGDDLAWLALADALEEHDQLDRAELTRLSVWLRRRLDDPQRAKWEDRLRLLLARGVRPCLPTRTVQLGLRFVLIPPGSFDMGSPEDESERAEDEGPVHRVTLTRAFWLAVVPLTQSQWRRVMRSNPSRFIGEDRPVDGISWEDCQLFFEISRSVLGISLRLPTEAEFEYACRAGTTTPFSFGSTITAELANYDASFNYCQGPKGLYREQTTPVGSFPPNAFGLHDMQGNVWQWCNDWYHPDYYQVSPAIDPPGPSSGEERVARGGSWFTVPRACRSAFRRAMEPTARDDDRTCRPVLIEE